MDAAAPDLEIDVRPQIAWEVVSQTPEDEKIYQALEKVKGNFNLWTQHFASEPAGWPQKSIEIWSVGQTLHPKSLSAYGLSERTDPDLKQRLERAITNYLFQEAGGGLEKWTGDKLEEIDMGIADKETTSLAKTAVIYYPELQKKFSKINL
ncbi:hypothetical protein A2962_02605 [Candidatus Woesebacteria bacterium RIFCSPLOWO2_01_FULL_39_61]|uniref:Uncharacterized protein n=1 Tax=Candidatus Woesebacteria bacterium RIFCSPHIGHO2_02_FULL_39_13 TaxID=1802505 RepID=A0A1F7Z4X6_9BACT|nr:MAG: hypothetical protein A2692_02925 [Candidatus Woesebacteria bacterium RIFCSPHIGHO2_01_FULL_39_95]OGM34686.1 MAG: hypothetical protein A3D01_04130 [Candidatus Woesebacteria bacterium RIFCSPHIGHO2_02_FULL_39_13]OGM38695.1 MAG: hypothetical protein A3E13_04505 [Candidatus Woesebacteria bacterium RIFCSPHIGHO2_12_FULL_40_20]OGM67229.1 MAG: hypothetical protein A2962_02605 [Candidatus Woesebacteria bacterium RIFCSPLOWO2_01_FULL_39_61]OGM75417.1 MAG: hypothetical protein A3H19_03570 [Candidatus